MTLPVQNNPGLNPIPVGTGGGTGSVSECELERLLDEAQDIVNRYTKVSDQITALQEKIATTTNPKTLARLNHELTEKQNELTHLTTHYTKVYNKLVADGEPVGSIPVLPGAIQVVIPPTLPLPPP